MGSYLYSQGSHQAPPWEECDDKPLARPLHAPPLEMWPTFRGEEPRPLPQAESSLRWCARSLGGRQR